MLKFVKYQLTMVVDAATEEEAKQVVTDYHEDETDIKFINVRNLTLDEIKGLTVNHNGEFTEVKDEEHQFTVKELDLLIPFIPQIQDRWNEYRDQMADYGEFPEDWMDELPEGDFEEATFVKMKEIVEGFYSEAEQKAREFFNSLKEVK